MRKNKVKKSKRVFRDPSFIKKNKALILVILLFILFAGFISYQGKKTLIQEKSLVQNVSTPIPAPLTSQSSATTEDDWRKYAVVGKEPIIGKEDTVEKFWSPNKEYYLIRIKPNNGLFKSNIVVYKSSGEFVFAFNPRTAGEGYYSGVAKRFHDFWIDNKTIVFDWDNGNYKGENHAFKYNLDTRTFSLLTWEEFDSDSKGGILIAKPSIGVSNSNLYYRTSDGSEISLGHLDGRINGLSPSGKYIVFLVQGKEEQEMATKENESSFYRKVFVAPIEKDGLSKAISVGRVRGYVGGVEGQTDYPHTIWQEDEKKFIVNSFLIKKMEFLNPLNP